MPWKRGWRTCFFALLWLVAGCADRAAYRHLDTAVERERDRDFEPALAAFRAAVEARPDDSYLRHQLGRAYLRRAMYGEAVAEMERALQAEPSYVAVYMDLAVAFEAQEMPEAAMGWLEQAIRGVPDHPDPYRGLTDLYLFSERLDEALALLEDAAERWPKAMWAHYRLGHLYQQLKWQDRAEAAFDKVLDLDPRTKEEYAIFSRTHAALGNVFYGQEKYEEAGEAYRKAIALNPRDHSSLNNLAWLYAVQGAYLDEGIRYSRLSLRLSPDSPSYLDTLAELHFRRGEHQRAAEIIRRAIALNPEDPQLKEHLQNQLRKFTAGGLGKA